jgi:hypothetical protein
MGIKKHSGKAIFAGTGSGGPDFITGKVVRY